VPAARACRIAAARRRGIDISRQRARQVEAKDFRRFDHILAMDRSNLADLMRLAPLGLEARARLFLTYAPALDMTEVPDPYYGGDDGFERMLDLLEPAAEGLLDRLFLDN
jgi:protein-tyrosine phosphatase